MAGRNRSHQRRWQPPHGRIPNFPQDLNGWSEDTAVVYGRAVIVMASDSDKIEALDRRTGELLWKTNRTEGTFSADYCLGVSNAGLFVAGKNVVRRYNIRGGKLDWEKEVEDSLGRGAVTGNAVYMPVRDSILVLDSETGKDIDQVGVKLTTDDPVGNVYVDGEKLWVTAPGRLITLTNLDHRLEVLQRNQRREFHFPTQSDEAVCQIGSAERCFD